MKRRSFLKGLGAIGASAGLGTWKDNRCKSCGAPLKGENCEYCGTQEAIFWDSPWNDDAIEIDAEGLHVTIKEKMSVQRLYSMICQWTDSWIGMSYPSVVWPRESWSEKGRPKKVRVQMENGWTISGVELLHHGEVLPEGYTDGE